VLPGAKRCSKSESGENASGHASRETESERPRDDAGSQGHDSEQNRYEDRAQRHGDVAESVSSAWSVANRPNSWRSRPADDQGSEADE
jgi:hypothetical protein